jgi:hypothetical protein
VVANRATKAASKAALKAAGVARAVKIRNWVVSKIPAAVRKISSKAIGLLRAYVVAIRPQEDVAVMSNSICYNNTPANRFVGVLLYNVASFEIIENCRVFT